MKDPSRNNQELPEEISFLKERIKELEQSEKVCNKAGEALRKSEVHYRSLFSNMLNGCAYCKMLFEQDQPKDFIYLDVNDAFEALTGLKNVTGKRVSEVIPGIQELDPKLFEIYGRVALTGIPERFEKYVEALGMWFSISVYSPRKGHFVSVFDVITERKRSEEALRASQLQLSEAMDLAHIVYWEFDPVAETFILNDPFYAFYGTTAAQEGGYRMIREEYAKRFVHPDDFSVFHQFVEQNTLRPGSELVADLEHRIIRRDGDVRHILARTRIVRDDSGRIIKRYGANQDITERKLAEEERERLILELKEALSQVNTLSGLLPICSSCKRIRNDNGCWEQMEVYIRDRSEAEFSHGICPECAEKLYPGYYKKK